MTEEEEVKLPRVIGVWPNSRTITFADLEWEDVSPALTWPLDSETKWDHWQARIAFENGWGASVVWGSYGVYGRGPKEGGTYELAILRMSDSGEYELLPFPWKEPIGWITENEVTDWLQKLQGLSWNYAEGTDTDGSADGDRTDTILSSRISHGTP